MTDRNHLVRAHEYRKIADAIERGGLVRAIEETVAEDHDLTLADCDTIASWFGEETSFVSMLRRMADDLRRLH
jgi:hypothetical protein